MQLSFSYELFSVLIEPPNSRALMQSFHQPSPRTGAAAAPVNLPGRGLGFSQEDTRLPGVGLRLSPSNLTCPRRSAVARMNIHEPTVPSRRQSHTEGRKMRSPGSPCQLSRDIDASTALAKAQSRSARKLNDSLVYIDGPQVYTCAQCRTHLTSHDEIISKSFHGRHGK